MTHEEIPAESCSQEDSGPLEIAIAGDLAESSSELHAKLLEIPPGSECLVYFDCPGGSPYSAASIMNLILLRGLNATAIVTGECSSAALWPFAACGKRLATPYSIFLFHPMRWQSEEHVQLAEAREWARHFEHLESQMDQLLADLLPVPHDILEGWVRPGRYVTASELAEQGVLELVDPTRPGGFRLHANED